MTRYTRLHLTLTLDTTPRLYRVERAALIFLQLYAIVFAVLILVRS